MFNTHVLGLDGGSLVYHIPQRTFFALYFDPEYVSFKCNNYCIVFVKQFSPSTCVDIAIRKTHIILYRNTLEKRVLWRIHYISKLLSVTEI